MTNAIPPGIAVALYGGRGPARAVADSLPLLKSLRPPIVQLHTQPDDSDAPLLDTLRRELPGVRIWIGAGCNGLADDPLPELQRTAERWGKWCDNHGVELLVVNAEGDKDPATPDWYARPEDPHRAHKIAAMELLLLTLSQAMDKCAIGFTSHDCPQWHPLPWQSALLDSPVSLHLPQVYPALAKSKGGPCSFDGARHRYAMQAAQWAATRVSPRCRPGHPAQALIDGDMDNSGESYGVYTQLWGIVHAGVAWLLDQSDRASAWALPLYPQGKAFEDGVLGLRIALECRRRAGEGWGAIKRFQQAAGLDPDWKVGPKTLAALGL